MINVKPSPDFVLTYGDLRYFQEKFDGINSKLPKQARMEFGKSQGFFSDLLFTALFWIGIMALFYFVLFRKMGGGAGGPGGQIFSIGKSRAKLFDEKDKIQVTFKDVAGLEGAKEEVQEVVDFLKNSEKYTKLGGTITKDFSETSIDSSMQSSPIPVSSTQGEINMPSNSIVTGISTFISFHSREFIS